MIVGGRLAGRPTGLIKFGLTKTAIFLNLPFSGLINNSYFEF